MDIASVFEWFAQESKSIAEQAAEPEEREKLAELALLWASYTKITRRSAFGRPVTGAAPHERSHLPLKGCIIAVISGGVALQ